MRLHKNASARRRPAFLAPIITRVRRVSIRPRMVCCVRKMEIATESRRFVTRAEIARYRTKIRRAYRRRTVALGPTSISVIIDVVRSAMPAPAGVARRLSCIRYARCGNDTPTWRLEALRRKSDMTNLFVSVIHNLFWLQPVISNEFETSCNLSQKWRKKY